MCSQPSDDNRLQVGRPSHLNIVRCVYLQSVAEEALFWLPWQQIEAEATSVVVAAVWRVLTQVNTAHTD